MFLFSSSRTQQHNFFFLLSCIFLTVRFHYHQGYHTSLFFFVVLFLNVPFFIIKIIMHNLFPLFSIFLIALSHYHRGYHAFLFFFCCPHFPFVLFYCLRYHTFLLLFSSFFKCFFFFHDQDYHA